MSLGAPLAITHEQAARWSWRLAVKRQRKPLVAVVPMRGVIASGVTTPSRINFETLRTPLKRAFSMSRVAHVVLLIDSPGGSPVQSSLIGSYVRHLAKKHKVPVVAIVEDVAASGGYWLACAADEILVSASSVVGSIGVISKSFGLQDLLARWSIERRVYTAGDNKSQLDMFEPTRPRDVRHLRANLDDIHQDFIAWVKDRRGKRLKGAREELFSGDFWIGRQAITRGLADAQGDLISWAHEQYGDHVRLRWCAPPSDTSWWRRVFRLHANHDLSQRSWVRHTLNVLEDELLHARYRL